jgi:hypothetical protein
MVERLGDAQLCTAAKGEGLESLLAPEYLFLRQNKLGRWLPVAAAFSSTAS